MGRTSRATPSDADAATDPGCGRTAITTVGVGSEFRGDDAIGLRVLRQLKGYLPAGARAIELTGDQSYLLELMRFTDAMIIVDAVQSPAPAGTVFRINAGHGPVRKEFLPFSTHSFDSVNAVELARALGILPVTTLIYGIVGKDFSYTTKLTPEVSEAVDIIEERILKDIDRIMSARPSRREDSSAKRE